MGNIPEKTTKARTRFQRLLNKIAGGDTSVNVKSKNEILLNEIAENGGAGGGIMVVHNLASDRDFTIPEDIRSITLADDMRLHIYLDKTIDELIDASANDKVIFYKERAVVGGEDIYSFTYISLLSLDYDGGYPDIPEGFQEVGVHFAEGEAYVAGDIPWLIGSDRHPFLMQPDNMLPDPGNGSVS